MHLFIFIFCYLTTILLDFSSPEPKFRGSDSISFPPSTFSKINISEASWSIVIKFHLEYLWGRGFVCIRFWARLDQNSCLNGNRLLPWGYNGENLVSTLASSFLIDSSLFLQVTRTTIKSRMGSKFGKIRPGTEESVAPEHLKKSP